MYYKATLDSSITLHYGFGGVLCGENTSLDVSSSPQRTPRIPYPVVGNRILEAGHRYMWELSTGTIL